MSYNDYQYGDSSYLKGYDKKKEVQSSTSGEKLEKLLTFQEMIHLDIDILINEPFDIITDRDDFFVFETEYNSQRHEEIVTISLNMEGNPESEFHKSHTILNTFLSKKGRYIDKKTKWEERKESITTAITLNTNGLKILDISKRNQTKVSLYNVVKSRSPNNKYTFKKEKELDSKYNELFQKYPPILNNSIGTVSLSDKHSYYYENAKCYVVNNGFSLSPLDIIYKDLETMVGKYVGVMKKVSSVVPGASKIITLINNNVVQRVVDDAIVSLGFRGDFYRSAYEFNPYNLFQGLQPFSYKEIEIPCLTKDQYKK